MMAIRKPVKKHLDFYVTCPHKDCNKEFRHNVVSYCPECSALLQHPGDTVKYASSRLYYHRGKE